MSADDYRYIRAVRHTLREELANARDMQKVADAERAKIEAEAAARKTKRG